MTTTDLLIGAAIVLLLGNRVRTAFLAHLHADRSASVREWAQIAASAGSGTVVGAAAGALTTPRPGDQRPGWGSGARWVVSAGVRAGFLVWLYDVTDGAAFVPFGFLSDLVVGTVWHPVVVALGLSEVVARVGAVVVRCVRRRDRRADLGPAVPVESA